MAMTSFSLNHCHEIGTNQDEMECINELSDDNDIMSPNDKIETSEPIILTLPSDNDDMDESDDDLRQERVQKISKQILNLNATKTNRFIFRPNHQKRYRVKFPVSKLGRNDCKQKKIDINQHPLFVNDPLIKIKKDRLYRETFGNGHCLYWVANGHCKYFNVDDENIFEQKCRYKHDSQFESKRFYCFLMQKYKKCHHKNCKFTHNLKDIPCQTFMNQVNVNGMSYVLKIIILQQMNMING